MNNKKRKKLSLAIVAVSSLPLAALMVAVGVVLALRPKGQQHSSPFWAKYTGLLFIVSLSCLFMGVAFIWAWEFQARIARKAKMRQLAQQLGFSYTNKMLIPANLSGFRPFAEFGLVCRMVSHVLRGVADGIEISIFDYSHPLYLSSSGGRYSGTIWPFTDTLIVISSAEKPLLFTFGEGLEIQRIKLELEVALKKYNQKHPDQPQQEMPTT